MEGHQVVQCDERGVDPSFRDWDCTPHGDRNGPQGRVDNQEVEEGGQRKPGNANVEGGEGCEGKEFRVEKEVIQGERLYG